MPSDLVKYRYHFYVPLLSAVRLFMEKKTLHIISHTHWDREWYMPFESHRYKLVQFFDKLLDTLDNDPSFRSFHLDGQAIVIEDYLEVKPENRAKIEKYIAEGRLVAGPWYILQDEYLTDGESNIRNLLYGKQISAKYGKVSNVGYFPDAFGNISQAPQILRGFGIDTVAFGRGVSPRKGDRNDTGEENYGKFASEVRWRSPDGSEVLGAVFLNWYNNGSEIPADHDAAIARLDAIKKNAERFATTPHLLLMNGCDHQPVQTDIGQIIEKVQPDYPDTLIHSNFEDYFKAIRKYSDNFGIFVGELDGEYSEGWYTLANTASARIYLKQLNALCGKVIEKQAEPLSAAAYLATGDKKALKRDYFLFIWKTLMQNHPHDSICGCSVDEVHAEMVTRFRKVLAAAGEIVKEETARLTAQINTAALGDGKTVTVFNPTGTKASEAAVFTVDYPENTDLTADRISLADENGTPLPCDIVDLGVVFDYILPDDRFRIPFHVRRFRISFRAEAVPALGYRTFRILTDSDRIPETDLRVTKKSMSNSRLNVKFQPDGSAVVTDRKTRKSYVTGIMVDVGDIGDEYVFRQTKDGLTVSTEGVRAKIELVSSSAAAITFKVTHTMTIPEGADLTTGTRVGSVTQIIENIFTLRKNADRLDVKTVIHNNAKNHRVTMLTTPFIETETVLSEGQFDLVKRTIKPWAGWKNPSKPGKMSGFFGLEDETHGLFIAGKGLCEYEVLRDGRNTMALTLHRGVHHLGDWGVFPTPEAQCLGTLTVEYSLIPYSLTGTDRDRAISDAYSFAASPFLAVSGDAHEGSLPASYAFADVTCRNVYVSALKMCETRDTVILRVYNPTESDGRISLDLTGRFRAAYRVNLNEDRESRIVVRNGKTTVQVPAKKIVTIELEK